MFFRLNKDYVVLNREGLKKKWEKKLLFVFTAVISCAVCSIPVPMQSDYVQNLTGWKGYLNHAKDFAWLYWTNTALGCNELPDRLRVVAEMTSSKSS